MSVSKGHESLTRILLQSGVAVEAQDKSGVTALALAVAGGKIEHVRMLLDLGADVNKLPRTRYVIQESLLHVAVSSGDETMVELLLQAKAALRTHPMGTTELHIAARGGHIDIARRLLDIGAKLDSMADFGWTPLHYTALYGHVDVARLLLEGGAEPSPQDSDGKTPLELAIRDNIYPEMIKFLTEASVQASSVSGKHMG
ncbi:hypothetical protein VTL71DRAFT_14719 [Oculimacula yallundae]|uniref:Uncharacterized protein n=1 Tax=Oculimacula yallundae TaxID=86028 RepID=A0ABR4CLJ3_9HELO